MQIHHVGYLVKSIRNAVKEFEHLGFLTETDEEGRHIVYDGYRQIYIAFMINGPYRIELVEPAGQDSPIYGLLKKYKNSPYHICYVAQDFDQEIKNLEESGWILFQPPSKAPAIQNRRVAFLMNTGIGMIEVVER